MKYTPTQLLDVKSDSWKLEQGMSENQHSFDFAMAQKGAWNDVM